jgi:RluA family pseudouridine synthase
MTAVFTNIAAYKFARLTELKPLRERLLARCKELSLKGTILLSTEGVNLFVAGGAAEIEALLADLRAIPGLAELAPKYSESAGQPFTRMLVRIKREIIAFGVEGIDPAARTSPKLPARELKRWLDEGRPVTLLDTRNDYEVRLGTFAGARVLPISHFRQFPDAVRALPEEMKEQPIVMFCTGGIRCEKAGPFMEREGFSNVHQLEGGILKYFEEVGGEHYEGECFVFDQRVGVDPALRETEAAVCYACLAPLTPEEQADPRYAANQSCPYCHRGEAEAVATAVARRQERLRTLVEPLPGSVPRDNPRPIKVPGSCHGLPLLEALQRVFPHLEPGYWEAHFAAGQILGPGPIETARPVSPERVVAAGEWFFRLIREEIEPPVNADLRILHEDEAIVVLDKPAPLPMHPCGRFNRNTLGHILDALYAPEHIRPAHRLDANTTGVLVCARTRHFARLLQPRFERGTVEKTYLARVIGTPPASVFTCDFPISAEPGALGSRGVDAAGLPARTEFRVREDGLIEARPLTGRTNQIRVHLWQLGIPIQGDPAYLPGGQLGEAQTLAPGDPAMCLHAWRLAFDHPLTGKRMLFEAGCPF